MINYASREINCKIVYYGPGLGGKTSNLEFVYEKVSPNTRGKLISLATETERTLFFDFLPVDLGEIRGFRTRFHLYTVPGQVYYNASRKLILKGVDGVVFVADSQVDRAEANQESMQNLYDNMAEHGYDLTRLPFVVQYNKRDLPNAADARRTAVDAEPGLGGRGAGPLSAARRTRSARASCSVERLPTGEWWERVPDLRGGRVHGRRRVRHAARRSRSSSSSRLG
jgi:signal recognition particle receptor subunit beta